MYHRIGDTGCACGAPTKFLSGTNRPLGYKPLRCVSLNFSSHVTPWTVQSSIVPFRNSANFFRLSLLMINCFFVELRKIFESVVLMLISPYHPLETKLTLPLSDLRLENFSGPKKFWENEKISVPVTK